MDLNRNHGSVYNVECPVCLEDFYTLFELGGCTHKFCFKCINNLQNKCALCREKFENFTFDKRTISNALRVCDPITIKCLLKLGKFHYRDAVKQFLSEFNVALCWTKTEHSKMIVAFAQDRVIREWLLFARKEGNESTHFYPVSGFLKRNCSGYYLFDFLIPEGSKKDKQCQIHLTRTLLFGAEDDVIMNALQFAVNENRNSYSDESLLAVFPQHLLMVAIISLDICEDKKNYHLAFDRVLKSYSYQDLCRIVKFENFQLEKDVEIAFSMVKLNPTLGRSKKQLLKRYNFTNDIDIRFLLEKKQCRINENGQIFY
jgi:hypothetical protein